MPVKKAIVAVAKIQHRILVIRKNNVMLSADLAELYGVEVKALNQAVKRNKKRFPKDFMFQLTREEYDNLKSQNVTSSWGGARSLPYAFTDYGILMLSSVLRSDRAIEVNINIMRAFTNLRRMAISNQALARKIMTLEKRYDGQFAEVFAAIEEILTARPLKKIGFT